MVSFVSEKNANYMLGQINHIIEETMVFVDILREHAKKGDIFSLDNLICDFTMDIIGAAIIDSTPTLRRNSISWRRQ